MKVLIGINQEFTSAHKIPVFIITNLKDNNFILTNIGVVMTFLIMFAFTFRVIAYSSYELIELILHYIELMLHCGLMYIDWKVLNTPPLG